MHEFPELIRRHQVDPGPLLHVGAAQDRQIPAYYEAGFSDMTIVDSAPERIREVRTRFPGVNVLEVTGSNDFRPGAGAFSAHTVVINTPGHELAVLDTALWADLTLLIVATNTQDATNAASSYDLVTEAVTTRGFVEVDRWTRDPRSGADTIVAFLRP